MRIQWVNNAVEVRMDRVHGRAIRTDLPCGQRVANPVPCDCSVRLHEALVRRIRRRWSGTAWWAHADTDALVPRGH